VETNPRTQTDHSSSKSPARPRILVADDDHKMLFLLSKVLGDDGYEVATVTSGRALISRFEPSLGARAAGPFELILADVRMPGCSGLEALEWLRAKGCGIPFILMTALSECDLCQRTPELGCTLLAKPFRLADLRKLVQASLLGATSQISTRGESLRG